jgi:hypothetical protein
MRKKFIISSGTGIADRRETANSATEALELVRHLMRLRRANVTIEDELGASLSFFQLKDQALLEKDKESARRS